MPRPNPRDPESDPAAALGESLRDLRTDAGFRTQEDFAKATGYARETISRAETGDSPPSADMLNDWLDACAATLRERRLIDRQYKLARKAKGPIPEFIELWLKREAAAAFLRLWALNVLPGLFQVYEYAHAMFILGGTDEDEAADKATVRVDRQAITGGPDAVQVTAIIYEPVLYCQVGTPEVMVKQVARLLELSYRPNIVIQVVRDRGYFPGRRGQFEIASGPKIPDTMVTLGVEDQTMDDPDLVGKSAALFERVRGYALTIEESRALIQEAQERWQGQQ